MSRIRFPGILGLSMLAAVFAVGGSAQSAYQVSLDTSYLAGQSGRLIFDLTSNKPGVNRIDIFNFVTDGKLDLPQTSGGLVTGDLIQTSMPARFTRIEGDNFFNELTVNLKSFGNEVSFTINGSENAVDYGFRDKFTFFVQDKSGRSPIASSAIEAQEGDQQPAFSLTIDGKRGGVFENWAEVAGQRSRTGPRQHGVHVTVTPIWTSDPTDGTPVAGLQGKLSEFCTRRCVGQPTCTAGEFGIGTDDGKFLRFDDVGNLKTRAALVESGKAPDSRVTVSGHLISEVVLRLDQIEFVQ